MDEDAPLPPPLVSLPPILPPSGRRLSATFLHPFPPLSPPTKLAWVSLHGRLLNSEEASSVRTIGGALNPQEALAWELFNPIHRFLIVALIGVAASESKKNHQIWQLNKSVQLRDQVLLSMQEKLDSLCELLNHTKEQSIGAIKKSLQKEGEICGSDKAQFADCDHWLNDQHTDLIAENSVSKDSCGNEVMYKTELFNEEPEERRMSDLSWDSSVTSASDIQLSSLALEQDLFNLKRDCNDKDTKIKELTDLLNVSEVARSKRVSELEDIIRRKNSTITKLKKELVVLEQKVVQLSRLRRPSSSSIDSRDDQLAHVRDNLLYDMESSTGPSSSDSDGATLSSSKKSIAKVDDAQVLHKGSASAKSMESRPVSGQKVSGNRKLSAASLKPNRSYARAELKSRRRS